MALSESKLPGVHSSRKYVEHLRMTHFALIAAAAGLIALVLTAKPYDARRALTQVQEFLELKRQWSTDWVPASVPLQPEERIVKPRAKVPLQPEERIVKPRAKVPLQPEERVVKPRAANMDNRTTQQQGNSANEQKAPVAQESKNCPASESTNRVDRLPFSDIVYDQIPAAGDPREDATVVELHLSRAWSPNPAWQERNEFFSQFPASNLREMKIWWDGLVNARSGAVVHELVKDCVVFDYSNGEAELVSCALLTHRVHSKLYPRRDWASLGRVDYKLDASAYFEGPPAHENCNYYNDRSGAYWFTSWYSDHLVRVYATYSIITIDQSFIARKLGESAGPFRPPAEGRDLQCPRQGPQAPRPDVRPHRSGPRWGTIPGGWRPAPRSGCARRRRELWLGCGGRQPTIARSSARSHWQDSPGQVAACRLSDNRTPPCPLTEKRAPIDKSS